MQPSEAILDSRGAGSPEYYNLQANPSRHPLTIGAADMPKQWPVSNGRVATRVPRLPEFSPSQQSFHCIMFNVKNWCGVRVTDILRQQVVVDYSTDTVFAHHGWRTTTLALNWPGYIPNRSSDASRRRFSTYMNGNTPMTRQGFAQVIAELIVDLYNCAVDKPVARGCENWAFSRNKVHPSRVFILSAHYYKNVWIPELYVTGVE